MRVNIQQTLREKLFDNPSPPHRQLLFEEFASVMFPARSLFLEFLGERHFERQVEIARELLLRLAYEARVFAPNKHLVNLLNAESRLAGTASREPYNGRDHFVHLVHLYLLGLYVFWYHESLHNKVREQFQTMTVPGRHRRKRAIGAFITAWRTFVLFHDLGYPWEIAPKLEPCVDFLDPFRRAWHYGAKDAAMFVLSQLVALEWLVGDEVPSTLQDDLALESLLDALDARPAPTQEYLLYEFMPVTARTISTQWGEARRMPVSIDALLPRLLRTVIPAGDLIAILESTEDGLAIAADDAEIDSFLRRIHEGETIQLPPSAILRKWALDHILPDKFSGAYHWVYYVRGFEKHWDSFLERVFAGDQKGEKLPDFRKFATDYLTEYPAPPSATAAVRFPDTAFAIYRSLLDAIEFDLHDDGIQTRTDIEFHVIRHEQASLTSTVVNEVLANLRQRLERQLESLAKGVHERDGSETTLITTPLETFLPLLLKPMKAADEIAGQLASGLSRQLQDRISLKRQLYVLYGHLKGNILTLVEGATSNIFGAGSDKKPPPHPDWPLLSSNTLMGSLETLLSTRLGGTVDDLANYHVPYAPRNSRKTYFCDHGLASGLLFAQIYQGWSSRFHTTSGAVLTELQKLICLRGADEADWLGDKSPDKWGAEILYSIFLHNIYPKNFTREALWTFKTRRDREPFTYLALLCDSLQPWDRKRLYNQGTGRPHYNVYAEHFNLTVLNNVIRVHEEGDDLHLEQRYKELRDYLEDYLEGVTQTVRLHLAEYSEK